MAQAPDPTAAPLPTPPEPARSQGVSWVLAATLGWGGSSAVIAHLGGGPAAAAPVALGGSLALLAVATGLGRRPWRALREAPRLYLLTGALEAFNLTTYVAALRLGSLPLVVSLHLSAPLLLIVADLVRGRRRFGPHLLAEFALVAGACGLVGTSLASDAHPTRALLGAGLALASAVTVALLIRVLSSGSSSSDPFVGGGLQLAVAGTLALPLAFIDGGTAPHTTALYVVNGILLLGPAFAFYWRGLRTLAPTTAGIAGLSEAPIAAAIAAIVFGAAFPLGMVAAGACVLGAVALARSQTT